MISVYFLVLTDDVIAHILTLNDNCRAPSLNCRTYSLNNIYREKTACMAGSFGREDTISMASYFYYNSQGAMDG